MKRFCACSLFAALLTAACQTTEGPSVRDAAATIPASAPVAPDNDSPFEYLRLRYDANGDGAVSKAEYAREGGHFDRLDRNGDGLLNVDDFGSDDGMMERMSGFRAQMLLATYFQDDENTEELSLDEMVIAASAYDTNGDEVLDAAEFRAKSDARKREMEMGGMGRMMMDGDAFEGLASGVDANQDGELGFDELVAFFKDRDDGDEVWTFRMPEPASNTADAEPQSGPRKGTMAPDFTLASPEGDHPVTLSSFRGKKPVALIFGSYT